MHYFDCQTQKVCHKLMKPIDIILLRVKRKVLWTVELIYSAICIFSNGYAKCGVHVVDEADRELGIVHFYVAYCTTASLRVLVYEFICLRHQSPGLKDRMYCHMFYINH